jgi:hypothetical protein
MTDGNTRYSEIPVTASQKTVLPMRRAGSARSISAATSVRCSIACSSRSPRVSVGGSEGVSVDGEGVDHHPVEREESG